MELPFSGVVKIMGKNSHIYLAGMYFKWRNFVVSNLTI